VTGCKAYSDCFVMRAKRRRLQLIVCPQQYAVSFSRIQLVLESRVAAVYAAEQREVELTSQAISAMLVRASSKAT
jgi:hypothetical protein